MKNVNQGAGNPPGIRSLSVWWLVALARHCKIWQTLHATLHHATKAQTMANKVSHQTGVHANAPNPKPNRRHSVIQ